jgi:hypothetical protein
MSTIFISGQIAQKTREQKKISVLARKPSKAQLMRMKSGPCISVFKKEVV